MNTIYNYVKNDLKAIFWNFVEIDEGFGYETKFQYDYYDVYDTFYGDSHRFINTNEYNCYTIIKLAYGVY